MASCLFYLNGPSQKTKFFDSDSLLRGADVAGGETLRHQNRGEVLRNTCLHVGYKDEITYVSLYIYKFVSWYVCMHVCE